MMMITSDSRIKELLAKGRKERSEAFFGMFKWISIGERRKNDVAVEKQAAPKQCCP